MPEPSFWNLNVIIAASLTVVVMAIQIGSYAARIAGVRTGQIATAISLFSLLVTASRLAALVITPSIGALADQVTSSAIAQHASLPSAEELNRFTGQIRVVLGANSLGVLLGALCLPVFLSAFVRGIAAFQRFRSIPRALFRLADPRVIGGLLSSFRNIHVDRDTFALGTIPKKLLVANTVLYMVYSVGVVAAYYASVLDLHTRTTATGLSGLVNGIGTIAFAIFIDPTTSMMVDETVHKKRPASDIQSMVAWLVVTALLGTMLSQIILIPAAEYIVSVARHFVGAGS